MSGGCKVAWHDWQRLVRIGTAASKDRARPILTGLYLENEGGRLHATATDSYKMAHTSAEAEFDHFTDLLLPAGQVAIATRTFAALATAQGISKPALADEGAVTVGGSPRWAALTFHYGWRMVGTLTVDVIDGKFPSYRSLVVRPEQGVPVSRLARRRMDEIRIYIRTNGGKEPPVDASKARLLEVAREVNERPVVTRAGFSPSYWGDLLRTTTELNHVPVVVDFYGPLRPAFFTNPADPKWVGILMPVRI